MAISNNCVRIKMSAYLIRLREQSTVTRQVRELQNGFNRNVKSMATTIVEEQSSAAAASPSRYSANPNGQKVSFEDYLALSGGKQFSEWKDGEIIEMSPPSIRHQHLSAFLLTVMRLYANKHAAGVVLSAPAAMKLRRQKAAREPDIFFLATERAKLLKQNYLDGAADLIVEIISPESVGRDRGEKFVEYEAAGVREYWLIDPEREQAEFYQLAENGRYRLMALGDGEVFRSAVLQGFWLRVLWLWSPPDELAVLRELEVI